MKISILWASMFGNAEDVAHNFEDIARKRNHEVDLLELNDVTADKLQEMKLAVIVTSTTGQGDLPHNGEDFWDWLENSETKFENLTYSVCALGDSSHHDFCGAGNKVNNKLNELGAMRLKNIIECDGDDEGSEEWFKELLKEIE
ncbi:MAG: hypothetical protein CBB97_10400 [Candidatus Endolissoclinum sp. TMED37]|nr:MAG: hypothetical protein CBB97_10400 [Candidatus Endolissoclinum sp. TMED37]